MASRRLATLAAHLNHPASEQELEAVVQALDAAAVSGAAPSSVNVGALRAYLDGSAATAAAKNETRSLLSRDPLFSYEHYEMSKEQQREVTLLRVAKVFAENVLRIEWLDEDFARVMSVFEVVAFYELSMMTKIAVHLGLWGGTLLRLGTQRHRYLLAPSNACELIGCFLMTEIGHGSNVAGVETIATYEASTKSFLVNSPTWSAGKFWIGAAGEHARMGVCFAQLVHSGRNHGVHVFIVPLRNQDMTVVRGVRIRDCGYKEGLNGIDNGAVWFDNLRIPQENLLNRFSDINEDGQYVSKVPANRHFGATLGALSMGRVTIMIGATSACKVAVSIAVRHAFQRRQFSRPGAKQEQPIISYLTHRRRLMPLLARIFAFDALAKRVTHLFTNSNPSPAQSALMHALSSGGKALASWQVVATVQTCRECMGGQGYRWANRIPELKADADIMTTFEGDNTVLCQSVARYLLAEARSLQQKRGQYSGVLEYMLRGSRGARGSIDSLDGIQALLQHREASLLKQVGAALAKAGKAGMYDAFQANLDLIVALGHAHVHRMLHETLVTAADQAPIVAAMLKQLATLSSLSFIEEHLAWYVCADAISKQDGQRLRVRINQLCDDITPHSLALCEAFGIPEKMLPDAAAVKF